MSNLYILNPTTQDHGFNWRVPENATVRSRVIPAGHQVQILRDVSQEIVNYVIDQHAKYGLVSYEEARRIKRDSHIKISLVYSLDPLPAETYELVDEINEDIVSNQMQLEKERSAIATMKAIEDNPDLNQGVQAVEVEISELAPKEEARKNKDLVKQKFSSKG